MQGALLKLYVKFQNLKNCEEGHNMAEDAMMIAMLAFACIASMKNVAAAVTAVFSNISGSLA